MTRNRETLLPVFEKVQNKEHWKNPIDAFIDPKDFEVTNDAIAFFTGTRIKSTVLQAGGPNHGKWHIKADGYFLGPCNWQGLISQTKLVIFSYDKDFQTNGR